MNDADVQKQVRKYLVLNYSSQLVSNILKINLDPTNGCLYRPGGQRESSRDRRQSSWGVRHRKGQSSQPAETKNTPILPKEREADWAAAKNVNFKNKKIL